MAYNTIESADDVDAIRSALGAEHVDLLAFSYGTRLALAYLHRHPAHVGRMVLQGVNGPGLVVKRPEMISRKLTRIGVLLAADSAWQGSTDLVTAAGKARARLTNSPATLTISNRRTGGQSTVSLGRDGLDALVALSLDDRRLPALLVSVAAGDVRLLTRFAEDAWNGFAAGTVGLMPRAVNCAADRPATRWATVRRESKRSLIGMPIDNAFLTDDFCRAVGYRSPPREFGKLLVSAVPALLLTGTLDATNPAENAAEVARYLSNAVRLDVENAAHEALTIPSVQDVVVDFFSGKDVRGRRVRADSPHFLTLDESLKAPVRRAP
jgi:pimeloyl-ACP methyl ester carboxylesterase